MRPELPAPRKVPRVSEIRDLLKLAPCVEALDSAGEEDFFDRQTLRFAYRFFRNCEAAWFDPASAKEDHESTPSTTASDSWERLCDWATRSKIAKLGAWVDRLTDHAPIYYSSALWNDFVRQRS